MVLPFRNPEVHSVDPTSLVIDYKHEQRYSSYDECNVHDWHFEVRALLVGADDEADDDDMVQVARGEALVVQLDNGRDPFDALDEHSENAMKIGEAIFDTTTGELLDEFADTIEQLGDRVLILTELEVEPPFRGQGLGPLIAGLAIEALSAGALAVVCYPAPLHRPLDSDGQPRDFVDDEWTAGVAKLSALWARLGFQHFRNGVHYIDTARMAFQHGFSAILEETVGRGRYT